MRISLNIDGNKAFNPISSTVLKTFENGGNASKFVISVLDDTVENCN
jgi:hypothetical protein